ncbi:MAG: RDD family protein [Prolixibacteraceae bacterium]|nr:RDD family protein [Prolixibacteraceae bacterium]MBN2775515.1 RDD family protein [Prolixibacteraceae bacterium]
MENGEIVFAKFWFRVFARLVDTTLVLFISCLPLFIGSFRKELYDDSTLVFYIFFLSAVIFHFFYYPILESTGGTLSKRLAHIKTLSITSEKSPKIFISYGHSLTCLVLSILTLFFILGVLNIFRSKLKQTFWDEWFFVVVIMKFN